MAASSLTDSTEAYRGLSLATKKSTDAFFFNIVKTKCTSKIATCRDTIPEAISAEFKRLTNELQGHFDDVCSSIDGGSVDRNEKTTACSGGGTPHGSLDLLLKDSETGNLAFYSELKGFAAFYVNLMTGEYETVSIKSFKPRTRADAVLGIDQSSGRCSIVDALALGEEIAHAPVSSSFSSLFEDSGTSLESLTSLLSALGAPPSTTGGGGTGINDYNDNNDGGLPPANA